MKRANNANAFPRTRSRSAQGGQAPLAMPHVSVADITAVDWHSLRAAGFVGCVFDKVRRGSPCRTALADRAVLTAPPRRTTP